MDGYTTGTAFELADKVAGWAIAMPAADRIALARELLEGTGRVVAKNCEEADVINSPRPEVLTIHLLAAFNGGWNAARAAMLEDPQ